MASETPNKGLMQVWCPLIPPDQIRSLLQYKEDLFKINEAYDDWRVSMRGKEFVSVKPGVFLDRIRMLMINVGIACGRNRDLAEAVQAILSDALRKKGLSILSENPSETPEQQAVKDALIAFFTELKFTRDIYPIEEIRKYLVLPGSSSTSSGLFSRILSRQKGDKRMKKRVLEESLLQCTSVLKRLYIRLLSLDPWGTE